VIAAVITVRNPIPPSMTTVATNLPPTPSGTWSP
jgi:hypothetical protein